MITALSVSSVVTFTVLCLCSFSVLRLTVKHRTTFNRLMTNNLEFCSNVEDRYHSCTRNTKACNLLTSTTFTLERVNTHCNIYQSTYLHPQTSALDKENEDVSTNVQYEDVDLHVLDLATIESTVNIHYARHMYIYSS